MSQRFLFQRERRERQRERMVRFFAWTAFLALVVMAADRALAAPLV